jgi:hypothetical protein
MEVMEVKFNLKEELIKINKEAQVWLTKLYYEEGTGLLAKVEKEEIKNGSSSSNRLS